MATSAPAVSVVMSVYNGDRYLREAVDSILAQTFTDFEFVIIDDGSIDKTADILQSYDDPRIRVITQQNHGLVYSLNKGIEAARGTYVARQDADDASEPDRLQRQIDFMFANPTVAIVGSSMSVIDDDSRVTHAHAVLLADPELRQELLVRSPFVHGSVLFRRDAAIAAGCYDQAFWPAEDYEFWLRLSRHGELANLDDCLYRYREHGAGISRQNHEKQQAKIREVQAVAWLHRRRLAGRRNIKLMPYKDLDMGDMRIRRILSTARTVHDKAVATGDVRFAVRSDRILAASPLTYKKLAGKMRRAWKKT